ncbi:ABC transporter ATP-binding protein [Kutzneria sp. CA-103260]|uniref:ABC transporter ATP-binding protein n=1 Tax=Kutzneria sp. CA-103260 TaxID=2802641 RepID=UPI001BF14023|nr:ABC transporter ATP-binding protein [Kutzneria sp. CA-103260]QUQ68241.1 iron ABC transporter ATP-binding protein [Kutzneria sp. CA-103260]
MSKLRAEGVGVALDGRMIVSDIALAIERGEFVGLVGPNGSGKTTLLRAVFRALRATGSLWLDDEDLATLSARELARRMAVVPQESPVEFDYTVREVVAMGRFPHQSALGGASAEDVDACARAISLVGLEELADRSVLTLSGGERQRAVIARALAQGCDLIVLDEPTNHLDIRYQHSLMGLLTGLGVTAVAALHDLNLAAGYCDRIYLLRHGSVVASGDPSVLTADLVHEVFGVRPRVITHPDTGRPQLLFPTKEFPCDS